MKKIAVVLIVLGVLAVLAGRMIDADEIRARALAQASQALGQTITIDGDVSLSLLPTPVLKVEGLRVLGERKQDWLRVERLDLAIPWSFPLRRQWRIETLEMTGAHLRLPAGENGDDRLDDSAGFLPRNISIADSTLTYCSAAADCRRLAILRSQWYPHAGGVRGEGDFRIGAIPIRAQIAFDRAPSGDHGRLDARIGPAALTIEGRAESGGGDWQGEAMMEILDPPKLASIARSPALDAVIAARGAKAGPILLKGEWRASSGKTSWRNLRLSGGPITAQGRIDADWSTAKAPRIDADLQFSPIDLAALYPAWRDARSRAAPAIREKGISKKSVGEESEGGIDPTITVRARVAALRWGQRSIFDVSGAGSWQNGAWRLDSLKASLGPSATLRGSGRGNGATFSGRFALDSTNLPGLLPWVGLGPGLLPGRTLGLSGSIATDGEAIRLPEIRAKIGQGTWEGAMTLIPGSPMRAKIRLRGDRMEIVKGTGDEGGGADRPLSFPSMIDARISLSLKELESSAGRWSNIEAKARLADGVLRIESLTLAPAPNIALALTGRLDGLSADRGMDLGIELATADMGALKSLVGGEFWPQAPLRAEATIRGGSRTWNAESRWFSGASRVTLKAEGDSSAIWKGEIESSLDPSLFTGGKTPPNPKEMAHLAADWRLEGKELRWRDGKGRWRDIILSGTGTIRTGSPRPLVDIQAHFGPIDLTRVEIGTDSAESTDENPWTLLPDIDGDWRLSGESIRGPGWIIGDWRARIRSREAIVTVEESSGVVNDGAGTLSARIDRGTKSFETRITLKSARAGEALQTPYLSLEDSRIDLDLTARSRGPSRRALRDALSGQGSITITGDMNAELSLAGASVLLGQGDPFQALTGALFGALRKERSTASTITSGMRIDRGVIRGDDLRLMSTLAQGSGTWRIDLPRDRVRAQADLQFSGAESLRITTEGPLDDPFARLKIRRPQNPAPQKPAKEKKGLDTLIDDLLGTKQPPSPPSPPSPPAEKKRSRPPPPVEKNPAPPPSVEDRIGRILDRFFDDL